MVIKKPIDKYGGLDHLIRSVHPVMLILMFILVGIVYSMFIVSYNKHTEKQYIITECGDVIGKDLEDVIKY